MVNFSTVRLSLTQVEQITLVAIDNEENWNGGVNRDWRLSGDLMQRSGVHCRLQLTWIEYQVSGMENEALFVDGLEGLFNETHCPNLVS